MAERLLACTIDLDALDLYQGIYGLKTDLGERARDAIPARAIERFGDLCATLGVAGTLFAVGRDAEAGHGRAELAAAGRAGHEIASHSFAHDYAFSRRTAAEIDTDLARAEEVLAGITGRRPVGFRAPGYTLTREVLRALAARGYSYDSSLLPSPAYYAVKATVMAGLAIMGRRSDSILRPPGQLFRPRSPHRDPTGLLELPIAVLPGLRLPYYGTLLTAAPEALAAWMGRLLAGNQLIVVELHGVDFCDASDGVPRELLSRQRDLRIPAPLKRRRIETALRRLLQGRRGTTLAEAAVLVSPGLAS